MRPSRGVTWVETLPDAVDFIREAFGIPERLDSESSQAYRTRWREQFLPPRRRTLHRCIACNGKRRIKHYFDGDSLFTSFSNSLGVVWGVSASGLGASGVWLSDDSGASVDGDVSSLPCGLAEGAEWVWLRWECEVSFRELWVVGRIGRCIRI